MAGKLQESDPVFSEAFVVHLTFMQMRTKIVAVVKLQKPQPADEGGYSRHHSGGEQLPSPDNVGERCTRAKVVKGERRGGTDVKKGMCRPGH